MDRRFLSAARRLTHKHERIPAALEGALALHSGQECKEGETERERERGRRWRAGDWDFPQDLRKKKKKEGERKQTVGAMDDRNKYRRRENGWVVLCTGSILFPTVEMTQLLQSAV